MEEIKERGIVDRYTPYGNVVRTINATTTRANYLQSILTRFNTLEDKLPLFDDKRMYLMQIKGKWLSKLDIINYLQ